MLTRCRAFTVDVSQQACTHALAMSWTACSTFTPLFFLPPLSASLKPLLSKPSLTPLLLISPRSPGSCLPPLTHYALYKHTSDKRRDVDCVVINTGREFRLVLVMSGAVYTKDAALKVQQLQSKTFI